METSRGLFKKKKHTKKQLIEQLVFKGMMSKHTILSVKGQLERNRLQTAISAILRVFSVDNITAQKLDGNLMTAKMLHIKH